jgi:hypothetical protein
MITLTAAQHARWVAAVAEWPTCPTCDGTEKIDGNGRATAFGFPYGWTCPNCVAGRVPQPVALVIEGEPYEGMAGICFDIDGQWWHEPGSCPHCKTRPPVGWRVPAGEPVELRATDPAYYSAPHSFTVLVARATVELLPVYAKFLDSNDDATWHPHVVAIEGHGAALSRLARSDELYATVITHRLTRLTLDPLPVPGRHWVAICTVVP